MHGAAADTAAGAALKAGARRDGGCAMASASSAQAVAGGRDQGRINLRRGVWHHPLVALYRESDFLVIDRAGAGENFELQEIAAALVIEAL